MDNLSNNKPIVIGGIFFILVVIIGIGFMVFGPEPTKAPEPIVNVTMLGAPSLQNPILHSYIEENFRKNIVQGYDKLGTTDMVKFKPNGPDSPIDFTIVDGAQFGSLESPRLKSEYPDGLPVSNGNPKTVLLAEVLATSPAGFIAKGPDYDELLRVGVTKLEGNAAFLPPTSMTVIIAGVNRGTYWHNVCSVNGNISLVKRQDDTDPSSAVVSVITVNPRGEITSETPVENTAKTDCLNIPRRQMIIKFASSVSSGGKNALNLWGMYQPYNCDGTPNTSLVPGTSPMKECEVQFVAPSFKTLVANSGQQTGNSLLVVSQWAQNRFGGEVLAFGYTNAIISVAYNDVPEEARAEFLGNNRVIYMYDTINSEHEWVCYTQVCVDLYNQMMNDPEFLKLFRQVTGFNTGYNVVSEAQTNWQITAEQFGIINIVPLSDRKVTDLIIEAIK